MKKLVPLLLLGCLFLVTPLLSEARGLVPCGGEGEDPCQSCHVVSLTNNVIEWLVMILGTIAAIIIVYAGVKLVTSGGNQAAMQSAKQMMTNIVIGYIIVLAGWLVIDFIMKAVVNQGNFGVWNAIECVTQPEVDENPWVSTGLENGAVVDSACSQTSTGGYNCSIQNSECTIGGGTPTVNNSVTPPTVSCDYPSGGTYTGSCSVLTGGPCSVANLTPIFGTRAEDASRMCNKESGGAPVRSGSDLCCGPDGNCSGAPSFSGGYFQINILSEADKIPGCTGSFYNRNGSTIQGDCVRRNSRGICTGWSCEITNTAMYNICMQGALNPATNLAVAKRLFDSRGFQPWLNSRNLCSIPN